MSTRASGDVLAGAIHLYSAAVLDLGHTESHNAKRQGRSEPFEPVTPGARNGTNGLKWGWSARDHDPGERRIRNRLRKPRCADDLDAPVSSGSQQQD